MWLKEEDISHAWGGIKSFMGNAWSHGHKFLQTVDRVANIGGRLLGAGAATGLLQGRALESGIQAAQSYGRARKKVADFSQKADRTVDQFRQAVPELNL